MYNENKEVSQTNTEDETRVEVVDKEILGSIDAKKIPTGYGAVSLDSAKGEFILTNDVGDVMLFIDPETRNLSTMEVKEVEWDVEAFLSGANDLPQEYQDAMEEAKMSNKFHTTKSPEGTELVHAVGKGTRDEPLEIIQRSTHVYKDISLVHLAMIKHADITQRPITVSLNNVTFTYTPKGSEIEMEATTKFIPPRKFEDIDKDLNNQKQVSVLDYSYHQFLIKNKDVHKDPTEWCREDYYGYGQNMASAMFKKVEERIEHSDL